ncbi:MAG TPA: hypothetical protein VLY86_00485 [Methanothrix sp.]|nr:hypothetical protein [Methanothrix sp.]
MPQVCMNSRCLCMPAGVFQPAYPAVMSSLWSSFAPILTRSKLQLLHGAERAGHSL